MKTGITILLLIVCSMTINAQKLDGSWKGSFSGPNGEMELVFTFKVDATSLSGTVTSPMGELPIENGKVEGNDFSFDISFGDQVMSHTAVLEGDIVKMSLPMMEQPMELIRVKEESKINGKWIGKVSSPEGEMELTFTFKVDGDKLTGKNSSAMGEMDFNGSVNGNDFSFDIDMQGMVISHKCKYLENDSIEMTVNVMEQDIVMNLARTNQ